MVPLVMVLLAAPLPGPDMRAMDRPLDPYGTASLRFEDAAHDFDVVHYDVRVEVFPQDELLECTTLVTFTPELAGLDRIRLDLLQLNVTGVTWDGSGPLSWAQLDDSLEVEFALPIDPGDTATVSIAYSGTPWNEGPGGFGGFYFQSYVFYHMGVGISTLPPSLGKVIFPCWDHPSDKASIEFTVTVPDTLYAVANGDLISRTVNSTDATASFHWVQPQPMSTYLAAFAVSDYVVLQDSTYDWIYYFVYPWEIDDALGSFQNVDLMMDRFQSVYAPYPWDTKFSFVETPGGDMEHLTQVYHIAFAINGTTTYDWLLAHEMSHHWWGNCVTEEEWSDVWLSEGFATYSEAVWMEYYGQSSYDQYVLNNIMKPYLYSGETFPLSAPSTPGELWSYTTYEKGASVLHMLRQVIGDDDFFAALAEYFDHHAYHTATTNDLRDHFENVTGDDIDWFFDTWVHGWGYPVYDLEYSWEQSGSEWEVTVDLQQVQSTPTMFTMPLEFMIHGSSQDSLVVMWNDQAVQSQVFTVPFQPQSVAFDPGKKVLSTHLLGTGDRPQPPPWGAGTLRLAPNPAYLSTEVLWSGMDGSMEASLFDLAGRMLSGWELTGSDRTLDLSGIPSGIYLVTVSGEGGLRQTAKLIVR